MTMWSCSPSSPMLSPIISPTAISAPDVAPTVSISDIRLTSSFVSEPNRERSCVSVFEWTAILRTPEECHRQWIAILYHTENAFDEALQILLYINFRTFNARSNPDISHPAGVNPKPIPLRILTPPNFIPVIILVPSKKRLAIHARKNFPCSNILVHQIEMPSFWKVQDLSRFVCIDENFLESSEIRCAEESRCGAIAQCPSQSNWISSIRIESCRIMTESAVKFHNHPQQNWMGRPNVLSTMEIRFSPQRKLLARRNREWRIYFPDQYNPVAQEPNCLRLSPTIRKRRISASNSINGILVSSRRKQFHSTCCTHLFEQLPPTRYFHPHFGFGVLSWHVIRFPSSSSTMPRVRKTVSKSEGGL